MTYPIVAGASSSQSPVLERITPRNENESVIPEFIRDMLGKGITLKQASGVVLSQISFTFIQTVASSGYEGAVTKFKDILNGTLRADPHTLVESLEIQINNARNAGFSIPDSLNPLSILEASCPRQQFYQEFYKLIGIDASPGYQLLNKSIELGYQFGIGVAVGPLLEEYFFRHILQNELLKTEAKALVSRVSPKKAEWIDTKMYTVFRVVMTSLCFSLYHMIGSALPESALREQLIATFFMGLLWGTFKETSSSQSLCVLAHTINNFVAVMSWASTTC